MSDFFLFNNWWSEKYKFKLGEGVRYPSFKIALNLFLQRNGINMVETGTTRMKDDWGAGMSTVVLGDFAKHYDKHLWTVDISGANIDLCREMTAEFEEVISYNIMDSISFLTIFPEKIDLLYLDSMDCPIDDEPNSPKLIASQQHQLKELEAAWDKLHDKSIVLLDDNNFSNGGKCKLSIEFLKGQGWQCLFNDKQSLWIK